MTQQAKTSEKTSDFLFILWAGGAALLSYALVYALRKPFTAATFDGLEFMGMDYKTATSIIQIAGYVLSKFLGIKLISELKREHRLRFIIGSVVMAEAALILFAVCPLPFNVMALFFNGLALGCMWGVIFSFIEGRKLSGILASVMGISIAFSSGLAKSLGLYLMNDLGVDAFWMPALIGGGALVLLILLALSLNRLPDPTEEDIRHCTKRVPMDARQRKHIFLRYAPFLSMLLVGNLFITVIRDIKEDFLVNLVDTTQFSAWAISGIDGVVTLIILTLFIMLSFIRSHKTVLALLLGLVIIGSLGLVGTAHYYEQLQLSPLVWMFTQSLGVYVVFLTFQTLFFERFVSCFHIEGNVGFFIVIIDFIGYVGTVAVLIFKELFITDLNWIEFYNSMVTLLGVACCLLFGGCLTWLGQQNKRTLPSVSPEREPESILSVNNI